MKTLIALLFLASSLSAALPPIVRNAYTTNLVPPGASAQVWTNNNGIIQTTSTNSAFFQKEGGLVIGTNTAGQFGAFTGENTFQNGRDVAKGEMDNSKLELGAYDSGTGDAAFALLRASMNSGGSVLDLDWSVGGVHNWSSTVIDSDGPAITGVWTNNLNFVLSARAPFGGMLFLDNGQSGADFVNFNTSFAPKFVVGNTGQVTAPIITFTGTTNVITFGATNAPPASAIVIRKWVSVLINGEASQYKIPLYE